MAIEFFGCYLVDNTNGEPLKTSLSVEKELESVIFKSLVISRSISFFRLFVCFFFLYAAPRPLGMESGAIKDSQINASSETENGTRNQSRLNSGLQKAWCVQELDSVRTLTVDLKKPYYITQVRCSA